MFSIVDLGGKNVYPNKFNFAQFADITISWEYYCIT